MGLTSPKTLNLEGTIKGENVVVIIDLGAMHYFILVEIIQCLKIPISPSKTFGVSLGTGAEVQGDGGRMQASGSNNEGNGGSRGLPTPIFRPF